MRLPLIFATFALLAGCHAGNTRYANTKPAAPVAPAATATYTPPCTKPLSDESARFECDRRSILAMAGSYRVQFAFDETAALAPGYAPHAQQRAGGDEMVEVIVDRGDFISLQHILVAGKEHRVIKHWRQDWQYQPHAVLRFRSNGQFQNEKIADANANARGQWSQTVFDVDDAPRYAGIGRWTHKAGVDAWTSDLTWRPLPRREYTKRKDYQALEVTNRHTLTPDGWIHEQDNTKLVVNADGTATALAREHGINRYTHTTTFDFSAGREYWTKTQTFWANVRAVWSHALDARAEFVLSPEPDAAPRIEALFAMADRVAKGGTVSNDEIQTELNKHIADKPARATGAVTP